MRKCLATACLLTLGLVAVALVWTCAKPPDRHCDFSLRMNELTCVRQRVNPYSVWHGDIELKPFYANTHKGPIPEGCSRQVNAYSPWTYAYMWPISLLPDGVDWFVYCALMALALAFVGWAVRHEGVFPAVVPFLLIAYPLFANCSVGNFGVFVLSGAVLSAWALNRNLDWLAGIGWALAMVKPQLGLLFAVPFLVRGKFLACTVAGGVCLALTIVMSFVLKTPVVDLLLQGPAANTMFFHGCGMWPSFLCGALGVERDILMGMGVGAAVCLILTWQVRKDDDWFVVLMPAAICGCTWTYASNYCQVMGWFMAFVLVRELVERPNSKLLWTLFVLAVVSLSRWPLALFGLCHFMGWQFPVSDAAFWSFDTLNSTVVILLASTYCVYRIRRY